MVTVHSSSSISLLYTYIHALYYVFSITVEPPNKGHVGDNINSAVLSFVERLSSFGGSKCIRAIGKTIFGTSTCVLCREVYYIVSLSRRVHYQKFHCNLEVMSSVYDLSSTVHLVTLPAILFMFPCS